MVKRTVIWDELARTAFRDAYEYIRQDSVHQAEKFKQEILISTKKLSQYPQFYPPDKYRKDKDANFRAFEKYSYRISYLIKETEIRVLRFRHIKQQPNEY